MVSNEVTKLTLGGGKNIELITQMLMKRPYLL